ncbi:MAG TPA: di-trans,poly-cis-decaprenylcistransferase, partial [Aliarcobacter thereius]
MERTSNNSLNHIAIIMDGNGRWAKNKGLNRTDGHEEGAKVVREITTYCAKIGIKYLTLYAFSTENWTRPKLEIEYLMKLLDKYLKNELKTLMENSIRFRAIGDLSKFSKALQKTIKELEEKTE